MNGTGVTIGESQCLSPVGSGQYTISKLREKIDDNVTQEFLVLHQEDGLGPAIVFQGSYVLSS